MAGLLMCLGYLAWVMRGLEVPRAAHYLNWLAPAGRLALTNYLVQSIVCTLVFYGYGLGFFEHLPRMFPHDQTAIHWFKGKPSAEPTAFRNGTLQGAYLIVAARALGLDCGAMSGFDNAKVDAAFFPDGKFKTNFLCNIGYGDHSKVFARSPRFEFDEVCKIL